jgi:hypothetical protein
MELALCVKCKEIVGDLIKDFFKADWDPLDDVDLDYDSSATKEAEILRQAKKAKPHLSLLDLRLAAKLGCYICHWVYVCAENEEVVEFGESTQPFTRFATSSSPYKITIYLPIKKVFGNHGEHTRFRELEFFVDLEDSREYTSNSGASNRRCMAKLVQTDKNST